MFFFCQTFQKTRALKCFSFRNNNNKNNNHILYFNSKHYEYRCIVKKKKTTTIKSQINQLFKIKLFKILFLEKAFSNMVAISADNIFFSIVDLIFVMKTKHTFS